MNKQVIMNKRILKLGTQYNNLKVYEQVEQHAINGNWSQFRQLIEQLTDESLLVLMADNEFSHSADMRVKSEILMRMKHGESY